MAKTMMSKKDKIEERFDDGSVSTANAAKIAGVSRTTIGRWVEAGRLKYYKKKFGKTTLIRVDRESLEDLLKQRDESGRGPLPPHPGMLNADRAAKILGVSATLVAKLYARGRLLGTKHKNRLWFELNDVQFVRDCSVLTRGKNGTRLIFFDKDRPDSCVRCGIIEEYIAGEEDRLCRLCREELDTGKVKLYWGEPSIIPSATIGSISLSNGNGRGSNGHGHSYYMSAEALERRTVERKVASALPDPVSLGNKKNAT